MVNIDHHVQVSGVAESVVAYITAGQESTVRIEINKGCAGRTSNPSCPGVRGFRIANVLCPKVERILVSGRRTLRVVLCLSFCHSTEQRERRRAG